MAVSSRTNAHNLNPASRKAEEIASRRSQACAWLESFIGPLNLSTKPSEQEFIACLRNGLILCNLINKIKPGTVPKVIDTTQTQLSSAYQYFENVQNFLAALQLLNLPVFEAATLERESLDAGSTVTIVDCILSLKTYHEQNQSRVTSTENSTPKENEDGPEVDSFVDKIIKLKFDGKVWSPDEVWVAHVKKERHEIKELKEQVESLKKALSSMSIENSVVKTDDDRRLSLDNSVVKTDHGRRLSLDSSVVKTDHGQRLNLESVLGKTDYDQRLSSENCVVESEKTECTSTRRRLSMGNYEVNMEKPVKPEYRKVSTPVAAMCSSKTESQIRRSLRTIGKLINPSKKNDTKQGLRQHLLEASSRWW